MNRARAAIGVGLHALPFALIALSGAAAIALRYGGDAAGPATAAYVWVSALAFMALTRPAALAQLGFAAAACGWGLAGHDSPLALWLATIATASAVGLLVAGGRERMQALRGRLSDAVRTDSLTGLLNRRAFDEQLELELARSGRGGHAASVLVAELDGLRDLGGDASERALRLMAGDVTKWKRRTDVAARIGADEFGVLLPETDERGAVLVAERLRRAAHRTFGEESLALTVSFGVASYPDHAGEGKALVRAADRALLAARDMGGDRAVIYSAEIARMLENGASTDRGHMQLATVIGLAEALDIRDTGTARHSQAAARYAELMAIELELPPERVERVRLAGILHDVGKIGISDRVLTKPGPLDPEEWSEMRTHPQIAARLLTGSDFEDIREWILCHHERPDGSGYPRGLSGGEIPLEARILAVADAYEAMTADRVYRPALGEEAARAELTAGAGTQFDPEVVDALMRALDREPARAARAPSLP
jgi:two-component system cell cycle response regulator